MSGGVDVPQFGFKVRHTQGDIRVLIPDVGLPVVLNCRIEHAHLCVAPSEMRADTRVVAVGQKLSEMPGGPPVRSNSAPRVALSPVVLLRREANEIVAKRREGNAA